MTDLAEPSKKVSVLFVCLGNICRSTMSEGVFRHLTQPGTDSAHPLIGTVDSAGTAGYHVGGPPDSRTMRTLQDNGVEYSHRARKVRDKDFEEFDWLLGMDTDNTADLESLRRRVVRARGGDESGLGVVRLFGSFGGRGGRAEEIDDPYYGGNEGFTIAYEQAERFSKAFLKELEDKAAAGKL